MTARRLTIWDFDDTLAASSPAVDAMRDRLPDVPAEDWYRDPHRSTDAASITQAIPQSWRRMAETPGDHIILTGRVHAAVLAWLSWNSARPHVREAIHALSDVISVSGDGWPVEGTAARKALHVLERVQSGEYDVITVYDDNANNLRVMRAVAPQVRLVHVVEGVPHQWGAPIGVAK